MLSVEDEDEAQEMLDRVVEPDTCLFCNKKSTSITTNLRHMNLIHGFFIPEDNYLVDLHGLMVYLGFKVGAGTTCLWCGKQFKSLHGVRLHMQYKDHCKILYDQEKAEEFKEFYDYSTQEQIPMKNLNELVIFKKKWVRQADRSNSVAKVGSSSSRQLTTHNSANLRVEPKQAREIKKFNSQRAKTLLRIGMTNNEAVRGRLRQQNPL